MYKYWIWLSQCKGITKRQAAKLIKHFGDPAAIYEADEAALAAAGVTEQKLLAGLQNRDLRPAEAAAAACQRNGWHILSIMDPAYPRKLREISDAPLVLYLWGQLPPVDEALSIGVVGTRDAGQYGLQHSYNIAAELAAAGCCIVSGGAAGVDTAALEGALDQGMPVIAVVAGGLDRLYPAQNEALFHRIARQGCVLTEYLPGMGCMRHQFLARNRLISGLSDGVLLTEAPERSGAMSTARHAAKQARPVFALPGPVNNGCFGGCHALIRGQAAVLVEHGRHILEHFGKPVEKNSIDKERPKAYIDTHKDKPAASGQQEALLRLLRSGVKDPAVLAERSGGTTAQVMLQLVELEVTGLVVRGADGRYRLKNS